MKPWRTAQFRTLTIINARLFYGKSPFVDATRNRILFQPESWNGKAVNDVGPRQQNFDGAANGEHQAIVYAQQFRLTTLFRLFSRQHVGYDLRNAVIRIFRSEEHTSELQSLMRISYAVFCLKKKKNKNKHNHIIPHTKIKR